MSLVRRREGGQGLVEFGLAVPILILLTVGLVDVGRGVYALNSVGNAARESARTAIVNQVTSDITARGIAQATSLDLSAGTSCVADPSASPSGSATTPSGKSGICVTFRSPDLTSDCSTSLTPGCVAVVTAKYTFAPITPLIGRLVGPVALTSRSAEVIESVCTTAGSCPIP